MSDRKSVNAEALDALRIAAQRQCREYPLGPGAMRMPCRKPICDDAMAAGALPAECDMGICQSLDIQEVTPPRLWLEKQGACDETPIWHALPSASVDRDIYVAVDTLCTDKIEDDDILSIAAALPEGVEVCEECEGILERKAESDDTQV